MYFICKTIMVNGCPKDIELAKVYAKKDAITLVDELRLLSQTQLYYYK